MEVPSQLFRVGATPADVTRQVVLEGMTLAALGQFAGVPLALYAASVAKTQRLLPAGDFPIWTLAAAVGVLLLAALAAVTGPALRASWIDPMKALRNAHRKSIILCPSRRPGPLRGRWPQARESQLSLVLAIEVQLGVLVKQPLQCQHQRRQEREDDQIRHGQFPQRRRVRLLPRHRLGVRTGDEHRDSHHLQRFPVLLRHPRAARRAPRQHVTQNDQPLADPNRTLNLLAFIDHRVAALRPRPLRHPCHWLRLPQIVNPGLVPLGVGARRLNLLHARVGQALLERKIGGIGASRGGAQSLALGHLLLA
ncbi:MAG: FtsX-like permease family protein [Acidobacteria bacterium]|nr:FtsX-like permease family protein [Acidobacteriota bacterium]